MQRGYTLVEIVVALVLGSAVVLLAVSGYVFVTRDWQAQRLRLETQQNLRATVDVLSREIRLAGADLPAFGGVDIRALDGTNSGVRDTITIRSNVRGAKGTLVNPAAGGATSVTLDTAAGFVSGMQAYILGPDGVGEYVFVVGVNQASGQLTLQAGVSRAYASGSTVYGAESQTFAIDASGQVPVLTVATATGSPQPVVEGIEEMNVRYVLNTMCGATPCVVDLPTSAEWSIVRMIQVDLVARSRRTVPAGDPDGYYRLRQHIEIKPRNLLL